MDRIEALEERVAHLMHGLDDLSDVVARLADDKFYIVTGTGFRTHDLAWISDHIPAGLDAKLVDVAASEVLPPAATPWVWARGTRSAAPPARRHRRGVAT